jgi:beta-glucosidase
MDGDEVVQAYVQYPKLERMPLKELKAFKRISVAKGAEKIVQLKIPATDLQKWDLQQHRWKLYPGNYTFLVGCNSADAKLKFTIVIKDGLE